MSLKTVELYCSGADTLPLIRPFRGLRAVPQHAAEVLAPPYDVLSAAEAATRARGRPWSFLHVSRAEVDLPEGTDPYSDLVYRSARDNLFRMQAAGVLLQDSSPCYYLYRLSAGQHTQIGLVAAASLRAYEADRIRRHELTRPIKERDRVRHIETLGAQTGPVLLAYRSCARADALLESLSAGPPSVEVIDDDGVRHSIWVLPQPEHIAELTRAFERTGALYIADGHHRSAAAARVAAARRAAHPYHCGEEAYNYFLAVLFPHAQLQILDYNRVVRDLNGLSRDDFLGKVALAFEVVPSGAPVQPERKGEFGMYLPGHWYRLRLQGDRLPDDPVARLDVSLLATHLLEPVLAIADPRHDARIDFVGGARGLGALEIRVLSGSSAVAFSVFPTSMSELMGVADAGEIMPPKSTWFEPKLADGLICHRID
jgi:uncharacterized protein (DUF1015 family)